MIRSSTRSVFLRHRHRSNGERALKEEPSTALESTRVEHRLGCSETDNEWHLTDEFDLVVLATGLTGVFSATKSSDDQEEDSLQTRRWTLPWIDPPHGPLGIAAHLRPDDPLAKRLRLASGEIHMVCGDDGYVGLVRLPNGVIDIAAALRSQRQRRDASDRGALKQNRNQSLVDRLADLLSSHPLMSSDQGGGDAGLESLELWLNERATLMTAPPLRRRRVPGDGRVVAIGDSAGYVEPMTGEGMTWGIESGIAVADLWNQRSDPDHFALEWTHALKTLQPKRRRLCGGITWAMRSEVMRRVTRSSLRHAPWIAKPITRGLACGPAFESTPRSNSTQ
ncbi:NAD binding site [Rhodopirellula sallentina]|uniref:NAD binding site n=1 Tax=Rhodopirellula sallentina TaxID=1263869 RepID=UPI0011819F15|nr:NAD binding site [Rhodopirellula sallentina]